MGSNPFIIPPRFIRSPLSLLSRRKKRGKGILNLYTRFRVVQDQNPLCLKPKKESSTIVLLSFFGWGTGIRTPEMSESESDALPLGDAPKYYICLDDLCIISKRNRFVNSFFEIFLNLFCVSLSLSPQKSSHILCNPLKLLDFYHQKHLKSSKITQKTTTIYHKFTFTLFFRYIFCTQYGRIKNGCVCAQYTNLKTIQHMYKNERIKKWDFLKF